MDRVRFVIVAISFGAKSASNGHDVVIKEYACIEFRTRLLREFSVADLEKLDCAF